MQNKEHCEPQYAAVQEYMASRAETKGKGQSACPVNTPRVAEGADQILIHDHDSPMHINLPRSRDPQDSPKVTKVLQSEYVSLPQIKKKKIAVRPFLASMGSSRSRKSHRSHSNVKPSTNRVNGRASSNSSSRCYVLPQPDNASVGQDASTAAGTSFKNQPKSGGPSSSGTSRCLARN